MTVAMLMKNTVLSAQSAVQKLTVKDWSLSRLPLNILRPVPRYLKKTDHLYLLNFNHLINFSNNFLYFSDIEIARAQIPKDISYLGHEIGLLPKEISLYGNKKAKISLSVLKRLHNQKDGKYVVVAGLVK